MELTLEVCNGDLGDFLAWFLRSSLAGTSRIEGSLPFLGCSFAGATGWRAHCFPCRVAGETRACVTAPLPCYAQEESWGTQGFD